MMMRSSKILAIALTALMIYQPLVPAIDSVMANNVNQADTTYYIDKTVNKTGQAKAEWKDLFNDHSQKWKFPGLENNSIGYSNGDTSGSVSLQELFYEQAPDSQMGSWQDEGLDTFEARGIESRSSLSNDSSHLGDAFETLQETRGLSRPDLSNDPVFKNAKTVWNILEGKDTDDCVDDGERTPDIKTCTKPNISSTTCESEHDYTAGVVAYHSGETSIASCGEGCIRVWLGREASSNYWSGSCRIFEHNMQLKMINPEAIQSARLVRAKWDDYIQVFLGKDLVYDGPFTGQGRFPPETNHSCELSTVWQRNPNVDLTSQMRAFKKDDIFDFKIRVSVTGTGQGFSVMEIRYDPNMVVDSKGWTNDQCIQKAKQFESFYGNNGAQCIQMPPLDANGCRFINGVRVCDSNFPAHAKAFSNISPLCQKVRVTSPSPLMFEGQATCSSLESNKSCGFLSSKCKYPNDVVKAGQDKAIQIAISQGLGSPTQGMINDQINLIASDSARALYKYALGRGASSAEIQFWANRIIMDGFQKARVDFIRSAEQKGEVVINYAECFAFEETWDCNTGDTSNMAACRLKDLFEDDFADCREELIPVNDTEIIKTYLNDSCEELLVLNECDATREIRTNNVTGKRDFFAQCFIEQNFSYKAPHNNIISMDAGLTFSGMHTSATITQTPSLYNDWTTRVRLTGSGEYIYKEVEVEVACPEPDEPPPADAEPQVCYETILVNTGEIKCPDGQFIQGSVNIAGATLSYQDRDYPSEADNFPCQRENDEWSEVEWSCKKSEPIVGHDGKIISSDVRRSVLPELYPGEGDLGSFACTLGYADYETIEYAQGEFCYTDPNGAETCLWVDDSNGAQVGTNTCDELRSREASGECKFVGVFPVGDSVGSTGFAYVREYRFECVDSVYEVTSNETRSEFVCNGIVSCLGEECIEKTEDKSADFGKAAGMLAALDHIGRDIECDVNASGGIANCTVFNGKAQTCKRAIGGIVNCCKGMSGVSLADYVKLIMVTGKVDSYLAGIETSNAFLGAYQSLRNPIANSIGTVTELFSNTMGNLTGGLIGGPTGIEISTAGVKNYLMSQANTFVANVFGEQVASSIFSVGTDGVVSFVPALQVIALAYTIYTVVKIIANIIWKCSEQEARLAFDKQLKKTIYLGTYCRKKVFGVCLERRESYCIFNSPLSRIIVQQAKPQLGRGFGSAKRPDCQGLTIAELEKVNWDAINFDEWLQILKLTGESFEVKEINMNSITGTGSTSDRAFGGSGRSNTLERNVDRLDGVDMDQINRDAYYDYPIQY